MEEYGAIKCVIHGSFRKHFAEIQKAHELFTEAGFDVLAPKFSEIIDMKEGFALLEGEENKDPRLIELEYLQKLYKLGERGFSYFVNPNGYIGKSASYELGVAQAANIPCFFKEKLNDHPAYLHNNSVWSPEDIVEYVSQYKSLPKVQIKKSERNIHALWNELVVPGSVVATGGIIKCKDEILLVKTHKWGNRFSIVGGKVQKGERLRQALLREVKEETSLDGEVGSHICTFDAIKNSGYYQKGVHHVFVDNIVEVSSKKVRLNEEAQEYVWVRSQDALKEIDIEPNARHTLELYSKMTMI